MVHVWYVEYGDTAHNIDPSAVYEGVLAEIRKNDPAAYIEEIRQYPYQIAFYVNHPTWIKTRTGLGSTKEELYDPITIIILCGIGITVFLLTLGWVIQTTTNYIMETRTYPCPGDPSKPETEECALHHDAEGNVLTFKGYSALLLHMSAAHPTALQTLKNYGATNWWEQIPNIIIIIAILIGAAIFVPLITKLIPSKEGG